MFESLDQFLKAQELKDDQAITVFFKDFADDAVYKFNEEQLYYPASLIKLFAAYMAQAKVQEQNQKQNFDEFTKSDINLAIKNSLKESDNDALSLLYDFISESNSGIYDAVSFADFKAARNLITQNFKAQGYSQDLALHNKCYSFAPYGCDLKLLEEQGSNQVSVSDIEKITSAIISEQPELLNFMARNGSCIQSEFIYQGLGGIDMDFYFSKAAWTSTVRHDVAYFSVEDKKYLLVILTKALSEQKDLVAQISSNLCL